MPIHVGSLLAACMLGLVMVEGITQLSHKMPRKGVFWQGPYAPRRAFARSMMLLQSVQAALCAAAEVAPGFQALALSFAFWIHSNDIILYGCHRENMPYAFSFLWMHCFISMSSLDPGLLVKVQLGTAVLGVMQNFLVFRSWMSWRAGVGLSVLQVTIMGALISAYWSQFTLLHAFHAGIAITTFLWILEREVFKITRE